jgi:hypothetical protein
MVSVIDDDGERVRGGVAGGDVVHHGLCLDGEGIVHLGSCC